MVKEQDVYKYSMLDLSTIHVTPEAMETLIRMHNNEGLAVFPKTYDSWECYGCLICVPGKEELEDLFPDSQEREILSQICSYASSHGSEWINLDPDGTEYGDLAKYPW